MGLEGLRVSDRYLPIKVPGQGWFPPVLSVCFVYHSDTKPSVLSSRALVTRFTGIDPAPKPTTAP